MNISLTPALEQFVNDKVATGLYNSVSEVIREALRLLISKEQSVFSTETLARLNKDIDEALSDYESGKYKDGHTVMRNLISKYEK